MHTRLVSLMLGGGGQQPAGRRALSLLGAPAAQALSPVTVLGDAPQLCDGEDGRQRSWRVEHRLHVTPAQAAHHSAC